MRRWYLTWSSIGGYGRKFAPKLLPHLVISIDCGAMEQNALKQAANRLSP